MKGKYPKPFLSAWDRFRKEQGTESNRPGTHGGSADSTRHMLISRGLVTNQRSSRLHFLLDTVDHYTSSQLYCIILLPYGGIDLEHCLLKNWRQAWTVLTQVAASLESKEQAPFWFEHRDLHWGNILVKGTKQTQIAFPRRDLHNQPTLSLLPSLQRKEDPRMFRNIPTFGIVVQMIDFTLARVQGGTL